MPDENPAVDQVPAHDLNGSPDPVATGQDANNTPPWGDDFDAEKAWKLVQNLRSDKERLTSRPTLTDEQKSKLAEYDRLVEASKTDLTRAQEAATRSAEQVKALTARAIKAEVKALASNFADPEDAAAFLDVSAYSNDDGDIDSDRIKADLADLLARKPHLGKSPATLQTMRPNPAQGRSDSPPMTVQERISAARQSGDTRAVMRLKAAQALQANQQN